MELSGGSQDKYDRFEQWLRKNGAHFDMLELREYDESGCSNGSEQAGMPVCDNKGVDRKSCAEEKKETVVVEESEMRGVHARSAIPSNTVCMSIPRRCLITVEMGQATPIGQAVLHADLDLDAPKHIFLMVYLLWDRKVNGPRSFFWSYYEILPQTLRNMPVFWTKSELAELQGSYLLQQIADRHQAIADDYHAICQVAPLSQICTLAEFQWARMCVCSRNFGLQIDGHRTSALVPHADMLNHKRPRETKWTFDESSQAFTITTLQHISAGAEIYDSYGQKCNHRFLLNYGFAVEKNYELDGFCPNEVPLELFVDPDDDLFAEKLDFWCRGEIQSHAAPNGSSTGSSPASSSSTSPNLHYLAHAAQAVKHAPAYSPSMGPPVVKRVRVCVSSNENTKLLFSLLRVLACNENELDALSRNHSGSPGAGEGHANLTRALFGMDSRLSSGGNAVCPGMSNYPRSCRDVRHPISIRNERAAMRLLLDVVARHLNSYPTSLSQDVEELSDESALPLFSNKRHAKIQVRGEKEVLHHFGRWARTALDVLDVLEEEVNEERGSIEVKLTNSGGMVTEERPTFEFILRRLEEDLDNGVHFTIFRYCSDVLGSLRREEFKQIRRLRTQRGNSRRIQERTEGDHERSNSGDAIQMKSHMTKGDAPQYGYL